MMITHVSTPPFCHKDAVPFSFSPKGVKGKYDKELGRVYESREGSLTSIFPPHTTYRFKQDAPVIVLATLEGGQRENNAVKSNCGVGFDIDAGMNIEDGIRLARESGFECLFYSTYSHQSQQTIILEKALPESARDAFADFWIATNGRITVAERKAAAELLRPHVADILRQNGVASDCDLYLHRRVAAWKPPVNGKFEEKEVECGILASHDPVLTRHKFRLVLLFATPFVGSAREYSAAIRALADRLGIARVIDSKAMNLAQAIYAPSCAGSNKARAVYEVINEDGPRVELRDFVPDPEEVVERDETVEPVPQEQLADAFQAAIGRLKMISDNRTFAREFYFTFPTSFRISRFMNKTVGERYVDKFNGDGTVLEVVCPHGCAHSSSPLGGYVMDAANTTRGWCWKCHHEHSGYPIDERPKSTVDYLDEALNKGWFTRRDMLSKDLNQNFDIERLAYDLAQESVEA